MKEYTMIDLCAGTGAFSYVFEQIQGVKCVFANDILEHSKKIYDLNHSKTKLTLGDINSFAVENIPKHDILCAGFPCQAFSIAGKKLGFKDKRSNVFWKILEIIKYHKPDVILLENVKNLTSHNKGETFKIIKDSIESIGYSITYNVLNTSKITGLPQNRERIYIAGFKDKSKSIDLNFQEVKVNPIKNFLEHNIPDKYFYTSKSKIFNLINDCVVKQETVYQYRRTYIRENKNKVCPTLTANMGTGGHNVPIILCTDNRIRKLTPRECFNLQGFDNNFKIPDLSDSKLYYLAGNAVTISVVKLIVTRLFEVLNNDH